MDAANVASKADAGAARTAQEGEDWDVDFTQENRRSPLAHGNDIDDDDEDQRDTIKLSQIGSSTLAQLREASQASRLSASSKKMEPSASQLSDVTGCSLTPSATSAGMGLITNLSRQRSESGVDRSSQVEMETWGDDEEDGIELPRDLTARLSSVQLSQFVNARGVRSIDDKETSSGSSNFDDDFDLDADEDLFTSRHSQQWAFGKARGESASVSERSSFLTTDGGWTEPESPTPSSSKHYSPSTTHSSPAIATRIRPFTKARGDEDKASSSSSSSHAALDRKASTRSFPADQSAGARAAGMLGVDRPGSDIEADFDIDASIGRLMLSPSLLHPKPSDANLGGAFSTSTDAPSEGARLKLQSKASSMSVKSFTSSSSPHMRQSSQASLSDLGAFSGDRGGERAAEGALDEEEEDRDESERQAEDTLDGLVLPPEPAAASVSTKDAPRQLTAASLRAMLKARRKGLLVSAAEGGERGDQHPLVSTPRKVSPSEDVLSGLVITGDGDVSPHRLNARRSKRAAAQGRDSVLSQVPKQQPSAAAATKGKKRAANEPEKIISAPRAGPSSRPLRRKASLPDLNSTSQSEIAGNEKRGTGARADQLRSQPAAKAAAEGSAQRPRFSPATQIFARALASTDAFKDRKPPQPSGQSARAAAKAPAPSLASSEQPQQTALQRKQEQRQAAQTSSASQPQTPNAPAASRMRQGGAIRYTVSTVALRNSPDARQRPPLPFASLTPGTTTPFHIADVVPGPSVTTAETTSDELISGDPTSPLESLLALGAPQVLRKPKRSRDYGDGTELDAFDDLPVAAPYRPSIEHRPVRVSGRLAARGLQQALGTPFSLPRRPSQQTMNASEMERSRSNSKAEPQPAVGASEGGSSNDRASKKKAKKRRAKKPMLIKNLGGAPSAEKTIGTMRWDPKSQKWEGNEADLQSFDEVLGSSSRPALITQYSSSMSTATLIAGQRPLAPTQMLKDRVVSAPAASHSPRASGGKSASTPGATNAKATIVGDMSFDPVKMCWVKVAGEEEEDVFADLDSDADGDFGDEQSASVDTPRADQGHHGVVSGQGLAMELPEGFEEMCYEAERVHTEEMVLLRGTAPWSTISSEDRAHLWLLPRMV